MQRSAAPVLSVFSLAQVIALVELLLLLQLRLQLLALLIHAAIERIKPALKLTTRPALGVPRGLLLHNVVKLAPRLFEGRKGATY